MLRKKKDDIRHISQRVLRIFSSDFSNKFSEGGMLCDHCSLEWNYNSFPLSREICSR